MESQKSSTADIKTHNQTLKNPSPKVLRSNDQINLVCSHDVSNENKQIGLRMRIEVVVGIGDAKPKNLKICLRSHPMEVMEDES